MPSGANSRLGQAKSWLNQGNLGDLLGSVPLPRSVKEAGNKVAAGFNKLSTTQKVVGGTLLALGVGYLVRGGSKATGSEAQADTLNELLYFVNDRIEGYRKATEESQDAALKSYYQQLTSQSQHFAHTLNENLRRLGSEPQTSTTLKGKVYRRFMAATANVTGHDEKAILATNVYGEEWAIKAYKEALSGQTLTGSLRQVVERQYALSRKTHEELLLKTKRLVAEPAGL